MDTILGATGVIGTGLARELAAMNRKVRLVSRNPRAVNPGDVLVRTDLNDEQAVTKAVEGSEVVYLTVGLKYDRRVWQEQWPRIMHNVLEACKRAGCRLVFFDNVYAYGKVDGWMTEETPMNPSSKKGEIRATIARMLQEQTARGSLKALIARAADFYGPGRVLSFVHALVFENLRKGKRAQWLVNDQVPHSLTYTPDAVRGTALLGNTISAFGQVWHLPTAKSPLIGQEFISQAARAFGVSAQHSCLSPLMLRLAIPFVPFVRESMEMLYQYGSPYLFDSAKFEQAFATLPTPYEQGIQETVRQLR